MVRMDGLLNEIKEPRQLFLKVLHHFPEAFRWMDDESYLKFVYRVALGKKLNLENPKTFNEKLQWLKLHNRKDIYISMVDKYEAKKYVADRIGDEYIIPTLGVWDNFDRIDFDSLPDQFVLKCTHDSGGLVICRDKSQLDKTAARKKIEHSLKRNFYWFGREWPYKNVKPRIIAEKYMEDSCTSELMDYKFFCFMGNVEYLYVSNTSLHKIQYFNAEFKPMSIDRYGYMPFEILPVKPLNFEKMKDLAQQLSQSIPHIRVDFYEINGRVFFGELTFYTGSGFAMFKNIQWDETLGKSLVLPVDSGECCKHTE